MNLNSPNNPPEFKGLTSNTIYLITESGKIDRGHAHANGHYYGADLHLVLNPNKRVDFSRDDFEELKGWIEESVIINLVKDTFDL